MAGFPSPLTHCDFPPGRRSGQDFVSLTGTPSLTLGEVAPSSSLLLTPLLPCRVWEGMGNPTHMMMMTCVRPVGNGTHCERVLCAAQLNLTFHVLSAVEGVWGWGGRRGQPRDTWNLANPST